VQLIITCYNASIQRVYLCYMLPSANNYTFHLQDETFVDLVFACQLKIIKVELQPQHNY